MQGRAALLSARAAARAAWAAGTNSFRCSTRVSSAIAAHKFARTGQERQFTHTQVRHSEKKPTTATDIFEELQQRDGGVREEERSEDALPKFDFSKAPPTVPPKSENAQDDDRARDFDSQRSELLQAAFEVNFGSSASPDIQPSPATEEKNEAALPKFNFSEAPPSIAQQSPASRRADLLSAASLAGFGEDSQPAPSDTVKEAAPASEADGQSGVEEELDYSPEAAMARFIAAQNPDGERGVPDYEAGERDLREKVAARKNKTANNTQLSSPQSSPTCPFVAALRRLDTIEQRGMLPRPDALQARYLCLWEKAPIRILHEAYPTDDALFCARLKDMLEAESAQSPPA